MQSILCRLKLRCFLSQEIPSWPCPQLTEKLSCNPRAMGCVGTLHIYSWDQPKSSCSSCLVRVVEGLLSPAYFVADKDQLFCELKGEHALPMACNGHWVYDTNVKDIMLIKVRE